MIRARIKAIRDAHSERSQIQAIDDDDLEYKLEVPTAALAGVSRSRELVLVMSWVIEEVPLAASSSVDAEFAALMASRQRPGAVPTQRDPLIDLFGTPAAPAAPAGPAAPAAPATTATTATTDAAGDRPSTAAGSDSSQAPSLESQLLTPSVKNQSSVNLERQLATLLGMTQ